MRGSPAVRTRAALAALLLSWTGAAAGQAVPPDRFAAEVAAAVDELRAELPMRVDDLTTLTRIRAEGTRFVYEMTVSRDIPADQVENARQVLQRQNQANLCSNADTRPFLDAGGSMRHVYTDPNGDRFETLVTACAG
jgi:hypothetical protein